MSDEGRLVAGRYRISRRIGTGAMGAVWQAHDELLARTVAIKQLMLQPGLSDADTEEARQRTMREGRIAARLHHQNAITVFDVVTDDYGQPCLIMEYLESTSLAAVLQEKETLPPLEVARIGTQIAAALKSAHRVGIVHRDIKPGNILLTSEGLVKITDFGISRAKDDVSVTKTGMIAGTPAYLAPEVAIGQDPGPESDIFSLGSTLYAACEGQPPFGLSENTLSLLHAVAAGHINPPQRSGPLTSVLAVLLHPDKEHRPDAEETEELLAAVARGETPLGGPVDADPTAMVAGAAGVAGLAAAGAAADGHDDEHDPLADEDDRTQHIGGHSGTLSGVTPVTGAADYDDGYAHADAGYPDDDPDATRTAMMSGMSGPAARQHVPPPPQDDADDERRAGWGRPAAAALLVVGGLAAATIWLLSDDPAESSGEQPPPVTSSAPAPVSKSPEPTTTTTTTTTLTAPEPPPADLTTEQPEPEPEPSAEPEPTTTTTTTTTTDPPTSSEPTEEPPPTTTPPPGEEAG